MFSYKIIHFCHHYGFLFYSGYQHRLKFRISENKDKKTKTSYSYQILFLIPHKLKKGDGDMDGKLFSPIIFAFGWCVSLTLHEIRCVHTSMNLGKF